MSNRKPAPAGYHGHVDVQSPRLEAAAGKLGQVTANQQKAIALLLSGCTLADTARRVGVSRTTLHTWTRKNDKFITALEAWRTDMTNAARTRLLGLSGAALKAIATALEKGDAKVALAMFKGLGVFAEQPAEEPQETHRTIIRRLVDRPPLAITGQVEEVG